jgi:hypothetical protein
MQIGYEGEKGSLLIHTLLLSLLCRAAFSKHFLSFSASAALYAQSGSSSGSQNIEVEGQSDAPGGLSH